MARMMARAFGICVIVAAALAVSPMALAFSCKRPSPAEAIREAPAVFSGVVIQADVVDEPAYMPSAPRPLIPHPFARNAKSRAVVAVHQVWKGVVSGIPTVTAPYPTGKNDGMRFRVGEHYLFFAAGAEDHFATSACMMMFGQLHPNLRAPLDKALADYVSKIEEIDQRIIAAPLRAQPLLDKGRFLESGLDFVGAVQAYSEAVGHAPTDAEAQIGLGRALLRLGRYKQALHPLERAVALNPGDEYARVLLRQAQIRTGDPAIVAESGYRGLVADGLDLRDAAFPGSDFTGSQLDQPDFARANLEGANFGTAQLSRAKMTGTNLRWSNLYRASAIGADLSNADLTSARLAMADLVNARLTGAALDATWAQGATLSAAETKGATFAGADLTEAKFVFGRNTDTDFADARLDQADFRGADLSGADLSRASLLGARFEGARYDCRTKFPPGFDPVPRQMLSTALSCGGTPVRQVFDGLYFDDVNFSGLDLRNASFRGASFKNPRFWDANLEGVDFSGSYGASSFQGANLALANFTSARHVHGFSGFGPYAFSAQRGANLAGAKLSDVWITLREFGYGRRPDSIADLARADLRSAIFDCTSLNRAEEIAFKGLQPWTKGAILRDGCAAYAKNP